MSHDQDRLASFVARSTVVAGPLIAVALVVWAQVGSLDSMITRSDDSSKPGAIKRRVISFFIEARGDRP
jgi:hypothetical protein